MVFSSVNTLPHLIETCLHNPLFKRQTQNFTRKIFFYHQTGDGSSPCRSGTSIFYYNRYGNPGMAYRCKGDKHRLSPWGF